LKNITDLKKSTYMKNAYVDTFNENKEHENGKKLK